jgi:hypothetical protein
MTPDYAPSLLRSFERHLRAENRSGSTIESYLESIRQAEAFLAGRGRTLLDARRADLEAFLGDLLQRRAPATAATRYKVLRILYASLEEEEEIDASPMAKMRPPIVPEQPVPIVPEDGLRRPAAHQPHHGPDYASLHRTRRRPRSQRERQRPPHPDHAHPRRGTGPHQRCGPGPCGCAVPGAGAGRPRTRRRPQVTAAEVIAATGHSRRRAYELLRDARTEQE